MKHQNARIYSLQSRVLPRGEELHDARPGGYGLIGTITYDTKRGEWCIAWANDCLEWNDKRGQSRQALEYIALAYALELEATGH